MASHGWFSLNIIGTLINLVGVICNLITFVTLKLNSKGFSPVSRMILQNQAITDSFVCIMGIIFFTQKYLWMTSNHFFNTFLCHVWHSQAIFWSGVLLSVWNVVIITVDRFILINHPLKHRDIQPKNIYSVFVITCILCILVLLPGYLGYFTKYDEKSSECLPELQFSSAGFIIFMFWWFIIYYAVPGATFIVVYTKTISTLRQRQRKIKETNPNSKIFDLADQQLTRTAGAVGVVFVIALSWDAWLCLVSTFIDTIDYQIYSPLQNLGVFFTNLHSCLNPFIYAAFLPAFRKSMSKTLRLRRLCNDVETSNKIVYAT